MSVTSSPLFQRGTAKPGGMYPKTDTQSPYKRNPHSCWPRQRDTYHATPVAPLSKPYICNCKIGDAAAVTLVSTHCIHSKRPTDRHRESPLSEGYGEAGGVCIQKQIQKVLISGIYIRAGSASGIHTPPLTWHPFQKGTLPPCRLYTQGIKKETLQAPACNVSTI